MRDGSVSSEAAAKTYFATYRLLTSSRSYSEGESPEPKPCNEQIKEKIQNKKNDKKDKRKTT
jgi:hypothetical protein